MCNSRASFCESRVILLTVKSSFQIPLRRYKFVVDLSEITKGSITRIPDIALAIVILVANIV